jgi:hypothetical protein
MASGTIIVSTETFQPTLINNFVTAFSLPMTFVRRQETCFVSGFVQRTSGAGQSILMGTLPIRFRPAASRIYIPCQDGSGFYQGRMDIYNNGDITYEFGNVLSPNGYLGFSFTYQL